MGIGDDGRWKVISTKVDFNMWYFEKIINSSKLKRLLVAIY